MLWAAAIPILGELLDKIIPDPEARDKAKLELQKQSNAIEVQKMQTSMSAILAEANSEDPWTSRARPIFLYVMYFVILMCVFGAVVGIWHPEEVTTASKNLSQLLLAIPDALWALFGAGYLGYTTARTWDKAKTK